MLRHRLRGIADGTETDHYQVQGHYGRDRTGGCLPAAEIVDSLIKEVKALPAEELMAQESLKIQAMTALFKQLQAELPGGSGWGSLPTYESAVRPKYLKLMEAIFAKAREAETVRGMVVEMQRRPLEASTCPGGRSPPQDMSMLLKSMSLADFKAKIGGSGIDLDAEFEASGGTLLTLAAEYHRADMVEVLLARGADPKKKSRNEQMTPLDWARLTSANSENNEGGAGSATSIGEIDCERTMALLEQIPCGAMRVEEMEGP